MQVMGPNVHDMHDTHDTNAAQTNEFSQPSPFASPSLRGNCVLSIGCLFGDGRTQSCQSTTPQKKNNNSIVASNLTV